MTFKKIAFLFLFLHASAQAIDLCGGRLSAGGHVLAQGVLDKNGNFRLDAEMAPEFGVFVFEGFETFARFRLSGPLYVNATPGYEPAPLRYGVSLGFRYFFDTNGSFFPYTGLALGVDAVGKSEQRYWSMEIPAGVLISLSDSLGVTIGAAVRVETTFYDNIAPALWYFPFGILGLKSTF